MSLTCGSVSDFVSPVAAVAVVNRSYAFGYAGKSVRSLRVRPTDGHPAAD